MAPYTGLLLSFLKTFSIYLFSYFSWRWRSKQLFYIFKKKVLNVWGIFFLYFLSLYARQFLSVSFWLRRKKEGCVCCLFREIVHVATTCVLFDLLLMLRHSEPVHPEEVNKCCSVYNGLWRMKNADNVFIQCYLGLIWLFFCGVSTTLYYVNILQLSQHFSGQGLHTVNPSPKVKNKLIHQKLTEWLIGSVEIQNKSVNLSNKM